MALGRKTGGRKKGTRNKRTLAQMYTAEIDGDTPLAYLLAILRDVTQPEERRMAAAVAAAPYVHSKLKAIEYRGPEDERIEYKVVLNFDDPCLARSANEELCQRGIGDNGGPPLEERDAI